MTEDDFFVDQMETTNPNHPNIWNQQPWSSGRTPRCGWEVPGSRPGRSRTLNCTHWVTRDPTPTKRVLAYEGGVYVTNAPLTAGSVKRPDWPHLAYTQRHLVCMPISRRRGRMTELWTSLHVKSFKPYDTDTKRLPDSAGASGLLKRPNPRQVMELPAPPQPRREKILHIKKVKKEDLP